MPAKKNKSKQKQANLRKANQNEYVLLRDDDTLAELIVDYNSISNDDNEKVAVGAEIIYAKTDRSLGHGTVLITGWFLFCNKNILLLIMYE